MAFAVAKSKADELIIALNLLIQEAVYLDVESVQVKKLFHSATQLMGADPSQANLIKAAIYQLCGNVEKVEYHLGLANKLPCQNKPNLYINTSIALSNLGLYIKSQEFFSKISDPTSVSLIEIIETGFGSLSILKMNELFMKAKKMKLNFNDEKIELTSRAAEVLINNNISDEEIAKYADVFGVLLREKGLMIKGTHPDVVVGDAENDWNPPTVFFKFKVGTDVRSAANLYKEGTKRLISKFDVIPEALHFSIEAF